MTERQKELTALLPIGVQKSKELTVSAKLILANIIHWYGTDYAIEKQSCYRTNKEMMNDTGIKSENSIIDGCALLQRRGLISREKGKRGQASTYVLNVEAVNGFSSNNHSYKNCIDTEKKELTRIPLNEITAEIKGLRLAIEELRTAFLDFTSKLNCSTDVDIEKDKESIVYDSSTTVYKSNPIESLSSSGVNVIGARVSDGSNASITSISHPIEVQVDNKPYTNKHEEQHEVDCKRGNISKYDEWNAEITIAFNELEDSIGGLFHSQIETECTQYRTRIESSLQWCNDNKAKFTGKQWNKVELQRKRWHRIENAKARFFNRRNQQTKDVQQHKVYANVQPLEPPQDNTKDLAKLSVTMPEETAETDTSNEIMDWTELFWKASEDYGINTTLSEFPLNKETLRFEDMSDKQRSYYMASPFSLTQKGELFRYIHAYEWLRHAEDKDSLFNTFHEKVVAVVGTDIDAQNRYIEEWNRCCEKTA